MGSCILKISLPCWHILVGILRQSMVPYFHTQNICAYNLWTAIFKHVNVVFSLQCVSIEKTTLNCAWLEYWCSMIKYSAILKWLIGLYHLSTPLTINIRGNKIKPFINCHVLRYLYKIILTRMWLCQNQMHDIHLLIEILNSDMLQYTIFHEMGLHHVFFFNK